MKNQLLNNEIQKLKNQNKDYSLVFGKWSLAEMQEASSGNSDIDLEHGIYIITKVLFQGIFDVNTWTANTKFLSAISQNNNVDYSNTMEVSQTGNLVTVTSDFASLHKTRLKLFYDLNNFITNNANDIHHASVEYVCIIPQV